MTITIIENDKGNPPGKLADAELHFADGPLAGLKLIGFGIWERRGGGGRNVTFPARSYSVNGERRSFALLRPAPLAAHEFDSSMAAQNRVRDLILEAYAAYEEQATVSSVQTRGIGGVEIERKIETAGVQLGNAAALRF
jgi:hypothetical protein